MTNPSGSAPYLFMRQGPQPNQTFPLNKQIITIGRLEDNDIIINDVGVSRHHARLIWQNNQWFIEDLGSQNGTFINEQPISGPTLISPGIQIGIGPNVTLGAQGIQALPATSKRKAAPKKKSSRLPILGIVGAALVGMIVFGALAVAGYLYFVPGASLPFWPSQASSDDTFAAGPGVVIQQPQPGVRVPKGDSILFSAAALDDSGVIRIDLWVDDQIVLSQTSTDENGTNPLSLNYPLVATNEGTYALVARAFNSQGLMGESPAHHVIVEEAAAADTTADAQNLGQYVVQDGDTLESIARRAGTTVEAIRAANPDMAGDQLQPGQVIVIPLPKATPAVAAVSQQGNQQPGSQQPGSQQPAQPVQQRNSPKPANPAPKLVVKSATANPSPVYYGQNCTTQTTAFSVAAKIDPLNEVSKVILAYAFIDSAGARTKDFELTMKLSGDEYKADVNVGKEAEAHLAKNGGKLDVRVEAYDKSGKLSYSPIYTTTVTYCPTQGGVANIPGVVGFAPAAFPNMGNLKVAGGGNALPGVVLNPGPGSAANPNSSMKAPDPVQATLVDECKVKLTWTDNTTNEDRFEVQRREPGSAFSVNVANLAANKTEYEDTLPGSGKYQYEVIATELKGGKVSNYVSSKPVTIDAPTTPGCQALPNAMRMIFQPVEFTSSGFSQGFINPVLDAGGSSLVFRLPQAQGTGIPLNQFGGDKYRIETWLPQNRAGLDLALSLVASGIDQNNKTISIGNFSASHKYAELTGKPTQVYQNKGQSQDGSFEFKYKFWVEPWLWGAVLPLGNPNLDPPTNLQLKLVGDEHQLTWDYDKDKLNQYVSGFNIYREYYCPGHNNTVAWPLPIPRGKPPAAVGQTVSYAKTITNAQMPQGCACMYQVSAFGQGGESGRANLKNSQDCLTFKANDDVTVTFKDVEISANDLPKAQNVDIYLWANYYHSSTANQKAHLFAGKHDLGKIHFGGLPGNTPMTVGVGQGQSLQIGFYLAGVCKSSDLMLKPPAAGWAGVDQDYTVSSADGGCKMTVHVKGSGAGQAPQNPPGGQNQPPQQPKYGVGCGDTGCSITFYNKTPYYIVGLNFTRLSNNVVENPISGPNLVIPPNGSRQIDQFYDEKYKLQAFYGTWAQGQAKPTTTGNGPVSPEFAGTAQAINIFDPKAPPASGDEALLRKILTAGQASSEYKFMWLFSDKGACPTIICNDVLRFRSDGTFDFLEADVPGILTTGKYKLVSLDARTGVASFTLIPDTNKATFSTARMSFNTNLFNSMSIYVNTTTVKYGHRQSAFNPQGP